MRIPVSRVRSRFSCHHCHTNLRSNHGRLALLAVPAGLLAEAMLFLLLWAIFGRAAVAFAVWSVVGGMAAVFAYWYIVKHYARLDIAGDLAP